MQRPSASSRPSSRASYLPVSGSTSGQSAQAKLAEKKKEYEALAALERASAEFRQRLDALSAQGDIMADGVETLGEVLSNWPNMFKLVNLFVDPEQQASDQPTEANRLVRLSVDAVEAKP
ncbi:hypothetical protein AURDEDRAFT_161109 [Auricularia subglabra TFB-10046 SS5]|nr:hypothetical protein AURDEDRAFT_161109 [Auricularia subglabra TFB-10046 SS5]